MTGTKLTAQEVHRIIYCGGNFTLGKVEMATETGRAQTLTFAPPYHLEDGRDYAFQIPPDGEPELWEVEQSGEGWQWSRRARRLGEITEDDATRH